MCPYVITFVHDFATQMHMMLTHLSLHYSEYFFESVATDHYIFSTSLLKLNKICALVCSIKLYNSAWGCVFRTNLSQNIIYLFHQVIMNLPSKNMQTNTSDCSKYSSLIFNCCSLSSTFTFIGALQDRWLRTMDEFTLLQSHIPLFLYIHHDLVLMQILRV
jgi:hypothetical protein